MRMSALQDFLSNVGRAMDSVPTDTKLAGRTMYKAEKECMPYGIGTGFRNGL